MIEALSEGFLLGIGAAVPLGPINILIMNNALKSYKSGVALGFGAMSADTFYLTLILAGLINFFNNAIFLRTAGMLGSFFLLYLAYSLYREREKKVETRTDPSKNSNILAIYTQGFFLTLLNPYTVIFWFSIAGYVANKNLNPKFTLLGLMSALLLWVIFMPYLVHRSKHKISQKVSKYLSIFSAFILFCFAISAFIHAVDL
jgi:L-lysine exporter family protein LysE/ArgO